MRITIFKSIKKVMAIFAITVVFAHGQTSPSSFALQQSLGLAPAVEYNLTNRLGILLGVRLFPWGRNTSNTITPAIAVNYVH